MSPDPIPPSLVVTFVHGTFAPGAPWTTREDNVIRARLRDAFPGRIEFRTFEWSGRNSHAARLEGGVLLAEHQAALAAADPGALRFLVAHSHGGNVAGYALREGGGSAAPVGVVTMGTPFISCTPRDLEPSLPILRWGVSLVAGLVVMAMITLLFLLGIDLDPFPAGGTASTVVTVLLAIYLPTLVIAAGVQAHRRFPAIVSWAEKRQAHIVERLRPPETRVPLLCIRVRADEAGRLLRSLSRVAEAPYALWRRAVAIAVYLAIVGSITYGYVSMDDGSAPLTYVVGISLLTAAVVGVFQIVMLAVYWQIVMIAAPMVRRHRFGFGGEGILDNWLTRIKAHRTPGCFANVTEKEYRVPSGARGLRHSWMYDTGDVADTIVEWIRARVDEGALQRLHRSVG